ncbi:MAG TPA: D-cysteine desulfhydrase family protein [Candidatus Dormibacteraeota bacterium]|nr:D-cysteine desulfhydrase family protein [Candidatus Dormibacteraeota bacterium]
MSSPRSNLPPLPDLPRARLLDGPTPLQPLERLSDALGGRAELWIKREDLGPLAFSGNKLRNLEFLLGAAVSDGADTIVTSGRRWSNHCRLTAAAGARLGLRVEIVVSGPPAAGSANLALIESLGATVHQAATDARSEREALVTRVAAEAGSAGRSVHVIPVGGSDATGAWGQVLAALEVADQAASRGFRPDAIVLPSATGGTQAGLVVGAAIAAGQAGTAPTRIIGVAVAHPEPELRPHVTELIDELATLARLDAPADSIAIDGAQLGGGYGIPSPGSTEAASLLARTEGILVDPVYTAKGLAGLISAVRSGALDGRRAIFWHGGGLPALFETLGPTIEAMPADPEPTPDVALYDTGAVRYRGYQLAGQMHGEWEFLRKDGTLMRAGRFERGTQVGVWRTFDRHGDVVKETDFSRKQA